MKNIEEQSAAVQVERKDKYPGSLAAGILFSLTTIFLTYGGIFLPFKNDYLRSGFGEVLFILAPVLILLFFGRYNIKDTLKLRKIKPINYLIIPVLMVTALPIVAVLNAIALGLIRLVFGKNLPIDKISVPDVPTLFIAILVVGISAAVCEEIMFRGLISKGYERYGVIASLAVTSVLFGILHRDIQKGVSTILLGALIGFIVYRTNSIYAGMIAHFSNNTIAVMMVFSSSSAMEEMELDQLQIDFSSIPIFSWVIIIVFYLMMFLGCVAVFTALIYAFCRVNKTCNKEIKGEISQDFYGASSDAEESKENAAAGSKDIRKFSLINLIALLPGLLLIIFTFVGQFLSLMNIKSGILYDTLKALWLIWPD
ncbi:hypothetical protein LY28_00854 [Ruminiclostridium sufflavum DSM 19573]|uniref:CAAX prenyl protease 2/Lysostaphin resistance protein A-like domain-containing protein n=1 Tax=Ruminiclostridium sufflavum DSM 19573 TaxID=1121337 RepID=A0A318XRF2_9FIRM|nr:type II CAAX endopeptidase family protein [Ruminiclostridium sufflavum]PYG89034.1 hypothetical protein LY28_00854 [Ruminiclostridium sufflavum DSM 19573]